MTVLSHRFPVDNRQWRSLWILLLFGVASYFLAEWVLSGQVSTMLFGGLVVTALSIILVTLNNWRTGFYLFLFWLLFEDLARKFLGNSMVVYFGKDVLVGVCYVSFFFSMKRGGVKFLRAPFLISLALFFWLGVAQMFNPNSPSIYYGLLGLKLYFYYAPLVFLGYALIQTEKDLHRFLAFTMGFAAVIAMLGAAQAIVGLNFLNPAVLAPELEHLGRLTRYAPISGVAVSRPPSVFVSDGRFASYLLMTWILGIGAAGLLLVRRHHWRHLAFLVCAAIAMAILLGGSRGSFMHGAISAGVLGLLFLWGSPRDWKDGRMLTQAIYRGGALLVVAVIALILLFPEEVGARFALYSETLMPDSPTSELVWRAWDYPIINLMKAFDTPEWVTGYGIGVSSLGVQYVRRLLLQPSLEIGVESGYGTLVIEMGILGLILWILWSTHLVASGFQVLLKLRRTAVFPLGCAIWWFSFLLLFPLTYGGIAPYQNFVLNAHFWLLVGILHRLPELKSNPNGRAGRPGVTYA